MKNYFPRMLHKHDDHLEIVFITKGQGNHLIGGVKYDTCAVQSSIFNLGGFICPTFGEQITFSLARFPKMP